MSTKLPILDPEEVMRRPMRLSELLRILSSGVFERDMCTILTKVPDARAVDDPICVVDDPVLVDNDNLETLPAYAAAEGLDRFCLIFDAVDTIDNTREQRPGADMATVLVNLDYYLRHDTWMDLDGLAT